MNATLAGTATAKLVLPSARQQQIGQSRCRLTISRVQRGRHCCISCLGSINSRVERSSVCKGGKRPGLFYDAVSVASATAPPRLIASNPSDEFNALVEQSSCEAASLVFEKNEKEIERRRKIADANRGRIPWNKGTPWTADVKKKISERTKEAMARPEIREKLGQTVSSGRRGHAQSQETREKIRQSLKLRHLKQREDNLARLITEGLSREEAEFQLLSKREKTKIINAKKREERRQQREIEAKAKAAAAAKRKEAAMKRLDSHENRSGLSSRIYKSEKHKRRISDSIRRKWQEKNYREKVLTGIRSYFDTSVATERRPRTKSAAANDVTDRIFSEDGRIDTSLGVDRELAIRKAELRRKALALIAMKKRQLNAQR